MATTDSEDDIVVLDGQKDCADNDVNSMIRDVIAEHPAAARKFLVRTPEIVKKDQEKREKAKAKSKKRKTPDQDDDDDVQPKAKKGKVKKDTKSESDDDPPITYYINIPKPVPATSKKRASSSKASEDDTMVQRGPFTLPPSDSYADLLTAIAAELPCREEHIVTSKITWKPKKPKNAEKLPLSKATGYDAMVKEMEGKVPEGRVVLLFMPPPVKPMDDEVPWETKNDPEPMFDYSQLEPSGANESVMQQKETFNKATKEERAKLEEKYPIGRYPQFPDRRVYYDAETGFYFELNSTRIGVWSSAMSQGKTDENKPPNSKFFDASQRIKVVPTPAVAPAIPAPPALPPAPAPAFAGSSLSLENILLASILSQPGGGLAALLGLNPAPPAAPIPGPAANAPPVPRSVPSSPLKRHTVSLAQFADDYNLEDGDTALLAEVGFRPGDPTEATLDEELKKVGFTFFSWKRIHAANVRFKADLAAARFD
ncbi:hypothetical protein B0H13DRAFT_2418679 [Mycena leptocephala]|nr:hypothetical protein B0H13DRAFT_2418679 [Mycena leptocephala]